MTADVIGAAPFLAAAAVITEDIRALHERSGTVCICNFLFIM